MLIYAESNDRKQEIRKELTSIIFEISKIEISDIQKSLFAKGHGLGAELFVYILLEGSKKFNFIISEPFVNSLQECSYESLENAIIKHCDQ